MVLQLRISFADARLWRYVTAATAKFIETAILKVNGEGLWFRAMDPSKTALIEFMIPKESFDEFEVDGEESLTINLEDFGKIMRSAERDDKISIKSTESYITLVFERRGVPRYFTLPLRAEHLGEEIPELSLELANEFKMPGEVLYESISGIEDVGEVLWIGEKDGNLTLRSESDLGEAEVILSVEKGVLEDSKVDNPGFTVSFGMEYFTYVKQPIKLADAAVLRADSDMPVHLELNFIQGAKLNYYVAPRAE
ncbi:MAG: hypothetical protein DRO10_02370 [Thermoprotei archaeon]|nr:MAG: hypothetical protein DRO10_02370 [Thermoprotei archaeon]HDN02130.1 hypothetical protein [Candidatus Bathyarchaeota archaeon]